MFSDIQLLGLSYLLFVSALDDSSLKNITLERVHFFIPQGSVVKVSS